MNSVGRLWVLPKSDIETMLLGKSGLDVQLHTLLTMNSSIVALELLLALGQ